jgi:Cof subfamily protein (haloacid dehalogenase superfamily)
MSPIRLVVSDVDGTLVDHQKRLRPATGDAVARLEEAGVLFTIVSARPRSGMMPIADTLGIDRPMGAFNGGTIFTRDGRVIEQHVIDVEVARGMIELARDSAVDTWVFADDRWYATTSKGHHVDSERVSSNQEPVLVDDVGDLLDRADKITFVSDDEPVLRDLYARAGDFTARATIVQSQPYYLDVTALRANKGDGVTALADAAGIPLDAVAAIGDQANDIPMLERVGLSVAMGNAPDPVKSVADKISIANDVDGVAHAIDTFILPRIGTPA